MIFGALLALVGALFHGIIGHIKYIGNVNSSDLPDLSKSLSLVSWHVFTIFLIISSMTLIYVALNPNLYIALYPIITTNLFGDLLSDISAQLTGSLGMLPSASLGELNEKEFGSGFSYEIPEDGQIKLLLKYEIELSSSFIIISELLP